MSSPSSHTYETIYILKSGLTDTDASVIHAKIDNVISKFEGSLKTRDDWGLKELAYPIDDETMGKFSLIHYTGKSGVVEEIERHFKISPDVIRFMTVAVEADYDYARAKKQMLNTEEEVKKNRELRKKSM